MSCFPEMNFLTERIVCSLTKSSASLADAISTTIHRNSDVSFTMPMTSDARLFTTQTTSTFLPRILLNFTVIAGRWSSSSSGLNSISVSKVSGVSQRMPYAYKSMSLSSHTVSLPSSNMSSNWVVPSLRLCESLEVPSWSRTT